MIGRTDTDGTAPTVYVIDDDKAVRDSLRWLIESDDFPVETYASATAFLSECEFGDLGCVLADVRMPEMSGLELLGELGRCGVAIPVIVITGHGDVAMAVRAMKAGAFDFVEKPFDDGTLLDLVRNAVTASMQLRDLASEETDARNRLERLTPREREVLDAIAQGAPNKAVAGALGISEKTVEAHRAHIMGKMEASSFAVLVRKTFAAGL